MNIAIMGYYGRIKKDGVSAVKAGQVLSMFLKRVGAKQLPAQRAGGYDYFDATTCPRSHSVKLYNSNCIYGERYQVYDLPDERARSICAEIHAELKALNEDYLCVWALLEEDWKILRIDKEHELLKEEVAA
jgi:hypothetical protein